MDDLWNPVEVGSGATVQARTGRSVIRSIKILLAEASAAIEIYDGTADTDELKLTIRGDVVADLGKINVRFENGVFVKRLTGTTARYLILHN